MGAIDGGRNTDNVESPARSLQFHSLDRVVQQIAFDYIFTVAQYIILGK